jgi:prefoldin subunit 5
VSGSINSHTYLVEQSQQYIGGSVIDAEKQALIEEINSLRQQLLDLNQSFTDINSLI